LQLALIVDDSKTARVMLRRMLDRLHIPAVMVESGEEALEYLKSNRPDVIFMDHMMPGMDGFAAVKAIKADPDKSSIPIIMHTTQQGDIYLGQAKALGAMDILSKPTTDQDLLQVLERITHSAPPAEQPLAADYNSPKPPPRVDRSAAITVEMPVVDDYPDKSRQGAFFGTPRQWLVALIWLIPSIWLFGLYLSQQQEVEALTQQKSSLYKSIEWLANQQNGYDYGDRPMSGQRLEKLSTLLPMLQRSGFKGVVRIEGHIGEFCLSRLILEDGSEALMLPQPELGLSECDLIGTSVARAMESSIEQSTSFANFLTSFRREDSGIDIELVPYGSSAPRYAYPVDITRISTGDWNSIALNNNRVQWVLVEKR
jgi:CheY-like chemotaxis protein